MRTSLRARAAIAAAVSLALVATGVGFALPALAADQPADAVPTETTIATIDSIDEPTEPIAEETTEEIPEEAAPLARIVSLDAVDTQAPGVIGFTQFWEKKNSSTRIAVRLTFDEAIDPDNATYALGQGWYAVSPTVWEKRYYSTDTHTVTFADAAGNHGDYTFTVDFTAPTVVNVAQVYQTDEGGRVSVTLTFSEPINPTNADFPLGQGWYGSGTTYTKAYYRTKTVELTFADLVGNPGTYSLDVVYSPPPVCTTASFAVTDANYATVFPARDPENFMSVPTSDGLGTYVFTTNGVRLVLPEDTSRVRWLHPVDLAIDCLETPALVQTKNPSGGSAQAVLDLDGNGSSDGGVYTDGSYEWTADRPLTEWLDAHGAPAALITNTTSKYTGTAAEWLAVFPNADIDQVGFAAGRFAKGTATFSSVSVAGQSFTFAATPAVCTTQTVAVTDATYATVFTSREPGTVIVAGVPAAAQDGTVVFEATGARFTLPQATSRVRWLSPVNIPLGCLGVPSLSQVAAPAGGSAQAILDLDGDGSYDGGVYTDGSYEWAAESTLTTWLDAHGYNGHPVLDAASDPQNKYTGSVAEWLAEFPSGQIRYVGVGVGRFAEGNVLISSVAVAGTTFTFASATPVTPPVTAAPTDLLPAGVISSSGDPASWTSVANAVKYQTRIADTADLSAATINGDFDCNEVAGRCIFPGYPLPEGTWYWQVRGLDADGNPGPWSEVAMVEVDRSVDVPDTLFPNGWHEDVDHFEWAPVTDDHGPVTYEVAIGNHPTNATNIITVPAVSGTTFAYDLATGPVQWRVRAIDALGNVSDWSPVRGAQNIGTPSIVTPTAGQNVFGSSLAITWTPVYGVGGLDAYELEFTLDRDHDGTAETETRFVDDPAWTDATTLAQYTQQFVAYAGDISVRVRGVYDIPLGGSVNGPWSASVAYYRPPAPQPVNPENGRMLNDATPLLDWDAVTTGYAAPVAYEVRSSTSPGRTPNRDNGELNGSDAVTVSGITDTQHELPAQAQGWVWWQVRAVDALGNVGPWSNIWATGVDTVAPTVTLLTPADGSTVATHDFSLTWSSTESGAGVRYDIRSSLTLDPVTGELGGIIGTVNQAASTLPLVGVPDEVYYWQVRAIDAVGNVGPWATPFQVTVDADEDVDLPTGSPETGTGGTPTGTGGTPAGTAGRGTTTTTPGEQLTTFALGDTEEESDDTDDATTDESSAGADSVDTETASEVEPAGFDASLLWLFIALFVALLLLLGVFLAWLRRRTQAD